MMLTRPPFALFVLADASTETLNSLLQSAYDGSTVMAWWWYLATPDYHAAPRRRPEGPKEEGTEAPIDPTFESRFLGKGLEDVAEWLIKKPSTVDVEERYFGVVDKQTARTGKIVVCRLNDPKKEKEVAWCILKPAAESTLYLGGLDSDLDWVHDVGYGKYEIDV